jgi:SAM-dependent methyltransferase/exonuclease VII small subunit
MSDTDARARSQHLVEQLNTLWRVGESEPTAPPSLPKRILNLIRTRLLRRQETFNSATVQYINESVRPLELAIDEYKTARDDVRRFQEALAARERRMEALIEAIRSEHAEIRTSLGVLQQATHNLGNVVSGFSRTEPVVSGLSRTDAASDSGSSPRSSSVETLSHKYVGFEDAFRGSQEDIQRQLRDYVPIFAGASDVLDIGCGRGEFLALLRESGVTARGIDLNDAMVAVCREKGFEATKADALSYLRGVPPGSLGGLFAAQVVEHLEPAYLTRLLEAAFEALRPGAPIVLETINPACWFAFFESYIRDITHVRPLHPDTLKFLLIASGFQQIEIRYRAPYPEHEKLQPIPKSEVLGDSVETLNGNIEKLNRSGLRSVSAEIVMPGPENRTRPTSVR